VGNWAHHPPVRPGTYIVAERRGKHWHPVIVELFHFSQDGRQCGLGRYVPEGYRRRIAGVRYSRNRLWGPVLTFPGVIPAMPTAEESPHVRL
jgi:hypothetical protein